MNKERKRKFVSKLWDIQNGLCHWCGNQMIRLPPVQHRKVFPANTATIDHLDSRFNPKRGSYDDGKTRRKVLACKQCNEDRGRESEKKAGIGALRLRAGNGKTNRERKSC